MYHSFEIHVCCLAHLTCTQGHSPDWNIAVILLFPWARNFIHIIYVLVSSMKELYESK